MAGFRKKGGLQVLGLVMTVLLSGGPILGFAPFHDTVLRETYGNGEPKFKETDVQIAFQAGFIGLSVGSVVFGLLLDRIGPRAVTTIGVSLVSAGCAVLAWTDHIVAGFVLFAVGGNGPYISGMTLGAYTPAKAALYVGLNVGLFNMAGFNFILLAATGASRAAFFGAYTFIAVAGFFAAFVYYPDSSPAPGDRYAPPPIVPCRGKASPSSSSTTNGRGRGGEASFQDLIDDPDGAKERSSSLLASSYGPGQDAPDLLFSEGAKHADPLGPAAAGGTFLDELRRPWLWYLTAFYSVVLFIIAFLGGALPDVANQKAVAEGDDDAGVYNTVLNPVLGNGVTVLLSPMVGVAAARYGFGPVFIGTQVACLVCLALTYPAPRWVQALTLLSYGALKALTIGPTFDFIGRTFPPHLYGSFVAFVTGAAAALGALTIPLVDWVDRKYGWCFFGFMLCVLPLSVFPYKLIRDPPVAPAEEPILDAFETVRGIHDDDDDDDEDSLI